jgi:hypothetical protein
LVGFGTLGISAIAVALTSPSKHPEAKKDLIALTTSFPTIPQQENALFLLVKSKKTDALL